VQSILPLQWRLTCALSSSSQQTLRNLVNRSVRRISEMYRNLDRRLKSTAEKEQQRWPATERRGILRTHTTAQTLH